MQAPLTRCTKDPSCGLAASGASSVIGVNLPETHMRKIFLLTLACSAVILTACNAERASA